MFLILDCWANFEYFKLNPKGKELKAQLPLPVRLFGIRLDKIEKALELGSDDIAAKEIAILRRHIQELPQNSVVIIEAATALNQIADENYWTQLNTQKIKFLRHEIKPLFRILSQVDFKAIRFNKDVLEISLALLNKLTWSNEEKNRFETLKDGLVEQISELPLSVPMVAREETLTKTTQHNHYWSNCTGTGLDGLAEKLAPLMQFREQQNPGVGQVKLDFTDVLHNKEKVEFGPQHEAVSITRYREMVEELIAELTDNNPILHFVVKNIKTMTF